jgi:hypothetical protein
MSKHPFDDDAPQGRHPFDDLPPIEEFEEKPKNNVDVPKIQIEEQPVLFNEPTNSQVSFRNEAIEAQLQNMQFPTQIMVRPTFDYRKKYHILNILAAEFTEIVRYKPPDAFWGNFALELLELMHDTCPQFRERLEANTSIITRIPKAEDKQNYIKQFMLDLFTDMLKENK